LTEVLIVDVDGVIIEEIEDMNLMLAMIEIEEI